MLLKILIIALAFLLAALGLFVIGLCFWVCFMPKDGAETYEY